VEQDNILNPLICTLPYF